MESFNKMDGLVNVDNLEEFTDSAKEMIAQIAVDGFEDEDIELYLNELIHREIEGWAHKSDFLDTVYTRICVLDEVKMYRLITSELHKKVTELRKAANSALNVFLYDEELENFLRANNIRFEMDEPADSNPAIPIIAIHEDDIALAWEKADHCDDNSYLHTRLVDKEDDNRFHWNQDLEDWFNEFDIRYAVVIKR